MPHPKSGRGPAAEPTSVAELNIVLATLVDGVRERLGETFVGAYLQGSWAVGDADGNSDCDFAVVIRRDLTDEEVARLNDLHAAIHELPYLPWRHRLEGSYMPLEVLRRWSPTPRDPPGAPRPDDWLDPGLSGAGPRAYPFVYLNHGAKALVRSEHDNTQVVRWSLREKGVILAGPDPRDLIDPVSPQALRVEVCATMDLCLALDLQPIDRIVWQSFWVGLFCRILHTLATGAVGSKRAGSAWAAASLDPRWRGLIERAQAARDSDNRAREGPADDSEIAETRAFVAWAMDYADRQAASREIIARRLAEKRSARRGPGDQRGGVDGASLRRSQYKPPTNRPGGRGRRG